MQKETGWTRVRKGFLTMGIAFLLALGALTPFGARPDHPEVAIDNGPTAAELPRPVGLPQAARELLQGVGDAFVENRGQLDNPDVLYYARGDPLSVGLTPEGAIFTLQAATEAPRPGQAPASPACTDAVSFTVLFDGRNDVEPRGAGPLGYPTNFLVGSDESRWVRGAGSFEEVVYEGLWDGIDLVYYFKGGTLKYDLVVHAGADPDDIVMRYEGVESLGTDAGTGDLLVGTPLGPLRDQGPVLLSSRGGDRLDVPAAFRLLGARSVGFDVPEAGAAGRSFVIDPGLVWATYIGGSSSDYVYTLDVDAEGDLYTVGYSMSADFPRTNGTVGEEVKGESDALIVKVDGRDSTLLMATHLGGSVTEIIYDLCVASDGDIIGVGQTYSPDLPVTADAFQGQYVGNCSAFLVRLNANLSTLRYCTFLDGGENEYAADVVRLDDGTTYVLGTTSSDDLYADDRSYRGTREGGRHDLEYFMMRFDPSLRRVLNCTYLGGGGDDPPAETSFTGCMRIDGRGNVFVCGVTTSTDLPTTSGAFRPVFCGGVMDGFIAKLDGDLSTLLASTYLGGSLSSDDVRMVDVSSNGTVYAVGGTYSSDFPTTPGAISTTINKGASPSNRDAFLAVLDNGLSVLLYGTYLGGKENDKGMAIALGPDGTSVYLSGETESNDMTVVPGAFEPHYQGIHDGFLWKIDLGTMSVTYSTYLGGENWDLGWPGSLKVDGEGLAYLVLTSQSSRAITTRGAWDRTFNGVYDLYLLKLDPAPCGLPDPPRNLTATPGNGTVSLAWDPHTNVGYCVESYRVYRGTAPGAWDSERSLVGTSTGLTDSPLTNGVRYYYGVSVVNSMGEGPMALVNVTPPAPSSDPGLELTTGDGNVTVNWSEPSDPGGDLFGYRLFRGPSLEVLGLILETGTSTLTYLDWNVTMGEEYCYAVLAFNGAGNGTLAWKSIIPSRPPSPPTSIDLAPDDGWIRVTWNVPLDRGGLPLKGYRVYIREEGMDDARVVEVDFTHLLYDDHQVQNGRRYYYRVTALAGVDYESLPTVELSDVPFGPPTAPTGLVVMPGDSQLFLEWNASDNNGRPITDYTIRWGTAPGELQQTVEIGNRTGYTVSGTQNGIAYYFQVAARNLAGLGAWSPEAHATPMGVPSEVLNLNANMTPAGVLITWDAPEDWGGAEELTYQLMRMGFGGAAVMLGEAMTERTLLDGTALAGETYRYRVWASNALSTGPPAEVAVAMVKPPTAVRDMVASLGDRAITLSWSPPEDDGSSNITVYLVYRRVQTGEYSRLDWTVITNYTDTGLAPGTKYWYYVTAKNDLFEGADWTTVNATAISHPGPVVGLKAVYRDGAVELEWSPPVAQWAAAPIGYRVLRGTTLADLAVVATLVPNLTYMDGTVERGRIYYYQVVAVSAVGDGEPGQVKEVQAGEAEPPRPTTWLAVLAAVVIAVLVAMVVVLGRRARAAAAPTVHIVEEVLVVLRDGRLIATAGRDESRTKDADLMSGMLVAIQGIAKEGLERGGAIRSINYADNTILMASVTRLYVAAVIYGNPDDALRGALEEMARQLEATYGDIIDGWDGDLSVFAGVGEAVRPLVERTRNVTREDVRSAGAAPGETESTP